jgi:trans-2,3-dihydro-3-hydroxyanthranilate isomerase
VTVAPTLAFQVVDVFTDEAYSGNPLAVVVDADDLDDGQMQRIAAEFNLSETSFTMAPERGDYRVRIFTPAVELPFAGHPSVGAAWVLHRLGRIPAGDVVQECGAGDLPVTVSASGATLTGGPAAWRGPVDAGPLLAAVGLSHDDLDGEAGRAGCGIDFTYLPVRPDAVARAVPDGAALRALDLGTGLSVSSWSDGRAATRVFVPEVGVMEDPATGSAALGYGVFLAATGRVGDGTSGYVVTQGVEMGRLSTLTCEVDVEQGAVVRATVSGSVVPVASGEIRRPAG